MRAMPTTTRSRQRGMTFIGVILWGVIIVGGVVIGSKAVPIMIENMNIKKGAIKAAQQGTTVQDVRAIYARAQAIDDMTSVSPKDLGVTKDQTGKVVVSYAYERDIPIYGPVYLVFRFNDSVK